MTYIDEQFYTQHGGDIKKPPYLDVFTASDYYTSNNTPKLRAFVSPLWYKGFNAWRKAADLALDTALMGKNPIIIETGIIITDAVEFDPSPLYLFDHSLQRFGELLILLNAAGIKTEADYMDILTIAEARRRLIQQKSSETSTAEFTRYRVCENGRRSVVDNLQDATETKKALPPSTEKIVTTLMTAMKRQK